MKAATSKPVLWILAVALTAAVMAPSVASAAKDQGYGIRPYSDERDGHPLALIRYALWPVGKVLEYGLFRPAYYITRPFVPEETCLGETISCSERNTRNRYRDARR